MRSNQHSSPRFFKTYNAAVHDYEQRMSAAWARALSKPGSQQRHQSWFEGVSSAARAISSTSSSAVSSSSKSSSTHIHTAPVVQVVNVSSQPSGHRTGQQPSRARKNEKSDQAKSDHNPSMLAYVALLSLLTLLGTGMWTLWSSVVKRDWQYNSYQKYIRRFERGTQRVQSVAELAFTLLGGLLLANVVKGVMLMVATLLSVPSAVLSGSLLFSLMVSSTMALGFLSGCVLANMAAVALVKWYYPLGTGYGRARMDSSWIRQNDPKSGITTQNSGAFASLSQTVATKFSHRGPDLLQLRHDNQIDALRYLKRVLGQYLTCHGNSSALENMLAMELHTSIQRLVWAMKQPFLSQQSLDWLIGRCRTLFDSLFNEGSIGNDVLDDLRASNCDLDLNVEALNAVDLSQTIPMSSDIIEAVQLALSDCALAPNLK